MKKTCLILLSVIILISCGQQSQITDMQCEYLTSPLGIDAAKPRFIWKFQSERKHFLQETYQLRIASSIQLLKKNKPDIWSSGKIKESASRCVYAGEKHFESHQTYYWDVTAWDTDENKYKSKVDSFEIAKLLESDWQAKWIIGKDDTNLETSPLFRKSFNLQQDVRSARAYISGMNYQLFINGQKIGRNISDRGFTPQDKRILYVTHDITPYLKGEENVVGVMLGNGSNILVNADGELDKAPWRNHPLLLCELRITYSNGSIVTIKSDNTWKTRTVAYIHNSSQSDNQQDGQLEETGWTSVGFNDNEWDYAYIADKPSGKLVVDNLSRLFINNDLSQTGTFKCSDSLLNKIWETTNQSYLNSLYGTTTDCHQSGNNGHTSDAHIAIDLALMNFDGITLYEKWMVDFIDNQREDGAISGIIPSSSWGYGSWPGPAWDAALFIIPNALYNYYGDTRAIEKLFPVMQKYLDYLLPQEDNGMLNFGLGDWVFCKAKSPNDYTSTVYYHLDYKLMARFATILGKDASAYSKKADEIKALINLKFFNPEIGSYANRSQTALALALYMGIVPETHEQRVAKNLHKKVVENDYFLDFGLIGSKTVPAMLAKYGYVEDVYKMAVKTDAPSWGYWNETPDNATRTESWTLSPQFRDASLNHVFMGDISAWMYNALAGINYDEKQPGFQHIIIQPRFVNDLNWVEGEYNSIRGLIKSSWKRKANEITMQVTIPPGATATIFADKTYQVGSGTYKYIINN